MKPLFEESKVKNISAGEFTYYSDFEHPEKFIEKNILYNFGFSDAALKIGKFCAIAHGVKFIMPDANHATSGVTTFPFAIFGGKWALSLALSDYPFNKYKDTVVGNDVWIGYEATIMPGITIGDGAIIGSKAVVAKDVPDYCIAVGNPARVVRKRFNDDEINILKNLKWWDWEPMHIEACMENLVKGQISDVFQYAKENNI